MEINNHIYFRDEDSYVEDIDNLNDTLKIIAHILDNVSSSKYTSYQALILIEDSLDKYRLTQNKIGRQLEDVAEQEFLSTTNNFHIYLD